MLQNKSTTIVSEVKDFFTLSEKAINTILTVLSSLTLSEKQIGLKSKSNNEYRNINKFLLITLFPFFDIQDAWHYRDSSLYATFGWGKDVFYRLLNDSLIPWRKLSYKISMQLIGKTSSKSNDIENKTPRCLIIDDSDLPKIGKRIELIGKVFSHVTSQSICIQRFIYGLPRWQKFLCLRLFIARGVS